MIGIKVTGIEQALAVAKRAQELLLQYTLAELDRFGHDVTIQMKLMHPPGGPHPAAGDMPIYGKHRYIDRTGILTGSIGYRVTPWTAQKALCAVFAVAPYASLVEYGHPANARGPAARPYPFFWPSFYMYLAALMVNLQLASDRAFEDAALGQGIGPGAITRK